MLVGQLGEKELIKRIREKVSARSGARTGLECGIGDDTAAFKLDGDITLLTSDVLVDRIHFDTKNINGFDLGYKAIAVNISDIAAMAGTPLYALVTLGIPEDTETGFLDRLYDGAIEASSLYNLTIVGGDTTRSECLFIDVTVVGRVEKGMILKRSTAKKGDSIYITGSLGASSLGLSAISPGHIEGSQGVERLKARHLRPTPRLAEGRLLASLGATAGEDVSDGLVTDLVHIAEESGVGFMLYEDRIPLDKDVLDNALAISGQDPLDLAYFGGEDYELVVTGPPGMTERYESSFGGEPHTSLTDIGVITDRDQGYLSRDAKGAVSEVEDRGYDHFLRKKE